MKCIVFVFWALMALTVSCGDDLTSDEGNDTDSSTGNDDSETENDANCKEGADRCEGGDVQRCTDGEWVLWDECSAQGLACATVQGEASCTADGDTDSNTEDNPDTDSEPDTGTDSGTDSGTVASLTIQAECAFGATVGDCAGTIDGVNSETSSEEFGIIPQLEDGDLQVGYMHDGAWLQYPNLDLTGYTSLVARVSTIEDGASFELRLDSLEAGVHTYIPIANTGSYDTYDETSISFEPASGIHTVYISAPAEGYSGNLDWIRLE